MLETDPYADAFTEFACSAEPKLRRALVAAYGGEIGREATAEALAYGWEHWARLHDLENPTGYLYRVGQSRARGLRRGERRGWSLERTSSDRALWTEPGLPSALSRLTERQRVAVVLVHGFEWTLREVADLTGTSVPTVQKHVERALSTLRKTLHALETEDDNG